MRKLIVFVFALTLTAGCAQQQPNKLNVNVEEAKTLKTENKNLVFLDVRTPAEVKQGTIAGAEHIDFFSPNFAADVEKLDKEKTYVVYCKSGGRSAKAVALMQEKGFENLYNLQGGITAWNAQKAN